MNLVALDYILLGFVAILVGNHVVFIIYENLVRRRSTRSAGASRKKGYKPLSLRPESCKNPTFSNKQEVQKY